MYIYIYREREREIEDMLLYLHEIFLFFPDLIRSK
jgi:hypothetical protein